MGFKNFWKAHKDELGKSILHHIVFKLLGWFEIIWMAFCAIFKVTGPVLNDVQTICFWIVALLVAFVIAPGVASWVYYLLFIRGYGDDEGEDLPLPPTEEELYPLDFEARHIIAEMLKDEHLTLLVTLSMGDKGHLYNTNDGAIICDGKDAIQSAKYDKGLKQLLNADYIRMTGDCVYKLTSNGIHRAQSQKPETFPTTYSPTSST